MRWASWANAALGGWLVMSPWVLRYVARPAIVNDTILGALVFVAGLWTVTSASDVTGPAWASVLFGLWLIVAPWVIGYSVLSDAMANDLVVGMAVMVVASIRIATARAIAGGSPPTRRMP